MKSNNNIEFEDLVQRITNATGLNDKKISLKVGRNAGYIAQIRSRLKGIDPGEVPSKFIDLLKLHFAKELKIENSSLNAKKKNLFEEDMPDYKTLSGKFSNSHDDLHTLIQSNKNLTEAKLIDSEAGLLLAQTNASLTARVLQNIDNGIKNEPEILEALNANMRGLLAAIAKVATGARYESEDLAVEALGKIVHDKHRKEKQEDSLKTVGN